LSIGSEVALREEGSSSKRDWENGRKKKRGEKKKRRPFKTVKGGRRSGY